MISSLHPLSVFIYLFLFLFLFFLFLFVQGNVESLYANIDKAYQEGNNEMSRLKKPFRLEMRKSEVLASYRAYYRRVSSCI